MADQPKETVHEDPDSTRKLKALVDTTPKEPWYSKAWKWVKKYVLAPLPILIIVLVAIVLIVLGVKDIQIGGLIGKLLGRDDGPGGKKAVDKANTVPADRVDKDGNIIPIGKPDSKGMTQAKVVTIKKPGLFDDPDKVTIDDPDKGEPVVVKLPDGVKAKDVDKVVIVKPEVYAVTVKDNSKVSAEEVDDLLAKYGD